MHVAGGAGCIAIESAAVSSSRADGQSGGADRGRTDDLLNAIQALSQLSYSPTAGADLTLRLQLCQSRRSRHSLSARLSRADLPLGIRLGCTHRPQSGARNFVCEWGASECHRVRFVPLWRRGGIGRRDGFKIRFSQGSAGSIPAAATICGSRDLAAAVSRGAFSGRSQGSVSPRGNDSIRLEKMLKVLEIHQG